MLAATKCLRVQLLRSTARESDAAQHGGCVFPRRQPFARLSSLYAHQAKWRYKRHAVEYVL